MSLLSSIILLIAAFFLRVRVLGKPIKFDISKVAISSFSVGGILILTIFLLYFSSRNFFFYNSLLSDSRDRYNPKDPRISPSYTDFNRFPRRCFFITAAYNSLAVEAENLVARLRETRIVSLFLSG
ncbi:unnamed protein product [Penicillium nalgiovense]|nr:unnamed protein product [Penicillium nalgiovense]